MDPQTLTGSTAPFDGPGGGVAPRAGLPSSGPPLDEGCVWVALHAKGWQEGEQGVIETIIDHLEDHIPAEQRWVVEFGAGEGSAALPVTVAPLCVREGWKSLLIEPHPQVRQRLTRNAPSRCVIDGSCVLPDGENTIDAIMARHECHPNPAVMVVDVDSIEYHIVEAMESRPIVLCVETLDLNSPRHRESPLEPYVPERHESGTILDDDFGTQLQANAAAFDALLGARGYKLVFRTRFNSVYVRDDLTPRLRKRKLNLGAGPTVFPGYEALDIKTGTDIRKLDLPDCSVDEVYCSHVLEHFPYEERLAIVKEWVRVLKPWGSLKIAVPDMTKLARAIVSDEPEQPLSYLESVVYGGHNDANDHHRAMFTAATLAKLMNDAGVGSVAPFKPFMPDCSQNPYSLNLEGVKRWYPRVEKPRIALVMSQPELTHTCHEESLVRLAQRIGFEIVPCKGAFWDRDVTIGTQHAIATHNPDFLLYSDYDSVFEPEDVQKLIDAMNADPTLAAIGSVQMSRHNDAPLVFDPEWDYSGEICRVRYSHFGLTLIRREVFEEMPQPWFWSVPGRTPEGGWDWQAWGRTDADITFWRNCDILGLKVCQHNGVCIGHSIRAIKYPCDKGKGVMLVPIENYRRQGKPKAAAFNPALYRKRPEPAPVPAPPADFLAAATNAVRPEPQTPDVSASP